MFRRSLFDIDNDKFKNICGEAPFYGYINCLKLAHEIGVPWNEMCVEDDDACVRAAKSGYLECLKYAWENGCPWDEETCNAAAWKGHKDYLFFAQDSIKFKCNCKLCEAVSESLFEANIAVSSANVARRV
ncbi:hypothetical protein QTP88_008816 [Uroleucon formosanum]